MEAEVVYPGWLMAFLIPSFDLRLACMQVYNDWISEFCAAAPKRLIGAARLPLAHGQIEAAIREAIRAKIRGLGAVVLLQLPDVPYDHPEHAPLWSARAELELPISIHISTGATAVIAGLHVPAALPITATKSK